MRPDWDKYRRVMSATEPDNLSAIPRRILQEYYNYLCSVPHLIYEGRDLSGIVARRVENLRYEMQARRDKANHRIAIAAIAIGALIAIAIAVWQYRASNALSTAPFSPPQSPTAAPVSSTMSARPPTSSPQTMPSDVLTTSPSARDAPLAVPLVSPTPMPTPAVLPSPAPQ